MKLDSIVRPNITVFTNLKRFLKAEALILMVVDIVCVKVTNEIKLSPIDTPIPTV